MPANISPIFTVAPNFGFGAVVTANTGYDGTGTVVTCLTAGANGAFLQKIIVRSINSNPLSVLRFWINNGSTPTVAANNTLIGEITCSAVTGISTAALPVFELPLGFMINPGYKLIAATAVAGTTLGWAVSVVGGDY